LQEERAVLVLGSAPEALLLRLDRVTN
jgi:hypothetical protein